ncbi:endonuclease V [Blastococcus colisei]|uniref:Endonuclease V n=1 Tax=Blastococcus colisei TaxID=1564162 RepID=A0A543PGD6_9ACTN|nr:endonuclease V [Blastococcus colisei]TQN43133.1 endonuclease V [Blastococcus colisei]
MDADAVLAEQQRLAALQPSAWYPERTPLEVAAAVVTYGCGGQGHSGADEPAWASAVLLRGSQLIAARVLEGVARAGYVPALLAVREGPLLAAAVESLGTRPDVLLLAAAGRDHPRRAGLALHLGAMLDVPSIGVTDRPLLARGAQPGAHRGDTSPLLLHGAEVARWVRTATGVRPLAAHAAWRTTATVAATVLLTTTSGVRTPQPLREARRLAREARDRRRVERPGW